MSNSSNAATLSSKIRKHILDAALVTPARGSHLGASLSCTDLLAALATVWTLNSSISPNSLRITLSKGHACLALYSLLLEHAHITLQNFNLYNTMDLYSWSSINSERQTNLFFYRKPGQGAANAVGQALFCKKKYGQKSQK